MVNISVTKQIGSIMIVIGTMIGAGILSLPILLAKLGFILATTVMIIIWALMTASVVYVIEANMYCRPGTSFSVMADTILGKLARYISSISFCFLMYGIMVAYISAGTSVIGGWIPNVSQYICSNSISLPSSWVTLIFVILLGSIVLLGVRFIDLSNRVFLTLKILFLLISIVLLSLHIKFSYISSIYFNSSVIIVAIPALVTSFTSHVIVPTLRVYLHNNHKIILRVFIIGSIVPLIFYILWVGSIVGTTPIHGPNGLDNADSINKVISSLHTYNYIIVFVNIFAGISVITSFLAVSISLFDFIIDSIGIRNKNNIFKKSIGGGLVFIIPLMIVLYANMDIFTKALDWVGVCCAILMLILPALMVMKIRKDSNYSLKYNISKSNFIPYIFIIFGIIIISIQLVKVTISFI